MAYFGDQYCPRKVIRSSHVELYLEFCCVQARRNENPTCFWASRVHLLTQPVQRLDPSADLRILFLCWRLWKLHLPGDDTESKIHTSNCLLINRRSRSIDGNSCLQHCVDNYLFKCNSFLANCRTFVANTRLHQISPDHGAFDANQPGLPSLLYYLLRHADVNCYFLVLQFYKLLH